MSLGRPDPQAVVIFGASGDLTERKIMPALYNLFREELLPGKFVVIGYSRTKMTDEEFREKSRNGVEKFSRSGLDDDVWREFASRVSYVSGDVSSEGAMHHLIDHLEEAHEEFGGDGRRLFYCATPPQAFPLIAERIGEEKLQEGSEIVIEKPFGVDVDSARELNEALHRVFEEEQIFRIDHYLGKETVQNILAFRFANGMFEPLWNRRHVAYAELNVAEDMGIESRGAFYEKAGAIRDIVQNHLLQLLSLLSMEPPWCFEPEAIRDEKAKLLRSIPPVTPSQVVRGQYSAGEIDGNHVVGYCEEESVAEDSKTETFVAMKLAIENWRWAGVPFYLRTGKRMASRATTVTIVFHDAPHRLFEESGLEQPNPNHLTLRIQPDEGISLTFDVKAPGPEMKVVPVQMDFDYEQKFRSEPAEAYERLLLEAMEGDQTLFLRSDEIEVAWEIVGSILEAEETESYPAGSWGPERADELIAPGQWHLH